MSDSPKAFNFKQVPEPIRECNQESETNSNSMYLMLSLKKRVKNHGVDHFVTIPGRMIHPLERVFYSMKKSYLAMAMLITLSASPTSFVLADPPVGDAFEQEQGNTRPLPDLHVYNPSNPGIVPLHRQLNPTLTDEINESHAFPEYLKKFVGADKFPVYYKQLIETQPVDQVQSKVFDPAGFKKVRRIGVVGFENKLPEPEKLENPGGLVANQLSRELETVPNLAVVSPKQMVEEYQMKIMTTPKADSPVTGNANSRTSSGNGATSGAIAGSTQYDLPYSADRFDAVMIGAVTRYGNRYTDRRGESERSPAVAMEFGAFLISTKTGEALWGARFTGSQHPKIGNILHGKLRWLNKREFTEYAIRKVLKDFSEPIPLKVQR